MTPKEYSLSGCNLGGPRARIVARVLAFNHSLTTLHLSRKNIQDREGQDMARALLTNTSLRKLEMEGNCLGMLTARVFALALRKNKTLRYLDLESNNLTNDTEENGGVEEMIQALSTNTTLLSLNLANNRLDSQIGRQFVDLFDRRQHNQQSLIDFEFGFNNFELRHVSISCFSSMLLMFIYPGAIDYVQVREIQDYLRMNKTEYDAARLEEWRERKDMRDEDHQLTKYYLERETATEQIRMEDDAKTTREREIDKIWKAMLIDDEVEKKRVIEQLIEAAGIRGSKGKGKKRGGKKKKKK